MSVLYEAMKRVVDEFDANKDSTNAYFGTVKTIQPLTIELDNKLTLEESYFVVAQHLTDYKIECEIQTKDIQNFFVEHEGKQQVEVQGGIQKGEIILKNALKVADRLILLRMEGGQQFIVLDRMEDKK